MSLRPGITVEHFRRRGDGHLPGLPGMRAVALGEGMMGMELTVRKEVLVPDGFLHAATVIGLADTVSGYGCIARPAHLGRTTHVWDATVTHRETGRTIALFRCPQMIL